MLWSRHRRLKAEIEAYRQKLASSEIVDEQETINCHQALLVITSDSDIERRVRSIQTLAQLKDEMAVPAAVNELVRLSKNWFKREVDGWPLLLFTVLRETRFKEPECEQTQC